jgi:hypothetical protein
MVAILQSWWMLVKAGSILEHSNSRGVLNSAIYRGMALTPAQSFFHFLGICVSVCVSVASLGCCAAGIM